MRRTLILIVALGLSAPVTTNAADDEKPTDRAVLESTYAKTLSSSVIDQDYRIRVALPYRYDSSEESYPVVYLLDSDVLFGLATDIARLLPLESVPIFLGEQRVPQVILVGIGYPGGFEEMSSKRDRDMNPPAGEVNSDGAANFYHFLKTDLIPWVESTYRARGSDRTLIGVSRGGVFVLSTLLLHPGTFQRYLAVSPVIEPPIYDYLDASSARSDSPAARLFLSAGSRGKVEAGIAAEVSRLAARLKELNTASLEWTFESFDRETHVSVVPKALVEGLVFIFAQPEAPRPETGAPSR